MMMKTWLRRMVTAVMGVFVGLCSMLTLAPAGVAMATDGSVMMVLAADVETSILPDDWEIEDILKLVLNVVVYGLGVAAVLGVVIAGIMYMTARDNEAQMAAARKRLYEIAIGMIVWALMYGVLNWLIPGGLNLN